MHYPVKNLLEISNTIDLVIAKIYELEIKYKDQIDKVHPNYTKSAKNLIHYLALRSFDIEILQDKLEEIGMPITPESKKNILHRVLNFKTIINSLLNTKSSHKDELFLTNKEASRIQDKNCTALFGKVKNKRKTAIMITQPAEAATDKQIVKSLLELGMDCARINCAHDGEIIWKQIINNIKKSKKDYKISMDLAGPKIRTGKMKSGPKVIHLAPKKNSFGQVTTPAKVWLAPYGIEPPKGEQADAIIPVNKKWLKKTQIGSTIVFKDSRGKKRKIMIDRIESNGRWGLCKKSAYVTTGTLLHVFFNDKTTSETHTVHELLPLEEIIYLFKGDLLRLDKEPILGEPTTYNVDGSVDEIAHISCTLPDIFKTVKAGEPIFFNDGKIEGIILENLSEHLIIEIASSKKKGGKLRADKGINLPASKMSFGGLTEKDKKDLKFIAKNADIVNFSFVKTKQDVEDLFNELKKLNASLGVILKIETLEGFKNLPSILLKSMENYPIGVMIARGDLAIEAGWKNFAVIQEEIIQLCDAAHLPDIWATQVLDNLAKKGIPTRAEITDAAMAQRAACVMLNKGPYIEQTVKMLDRILSKMQRIQKKKNTLLPKLDFNAI